MSNKKREIMSKEKEKGFNKQVIPVCYGYIWMILTI
jgi:hypothetical protein